MAIDRASIVEFLNRQYLFKGLTPAQLAKCAVYFDSITYAKNAVVYLQNKLGDSLYIIYSGKIKFTYEEDGIEQRAGTLTAGDYFGEESLLLNHFHSTTAIASEPTVVLHLSRLAFIKLIENFPQIKSSLLTTIESHRIAKTQKFSWMGEEELIYLLCRKHWFFLILSLLVPITLLLLAIPVLVYGWTQNLADIYLSIVRIIGFVMVVSGILWGIWNWVDWGNDYYIITNQRVLWLEKIIGLYESSNEVPLDSILSINTSSSQLGRILGYGSVNIRTYTGGIVMRKMDRPGLFASIVEFTQQRLALTSEAEELEDIKRTVRQALREGKNPIEISSQTYKDISASSESETQAITPSTQKRGRVSSWLNKLLKVRYVEGNNITYRKHWFVLFKKAMASSLAFFFLLIITIFLFWLHFTRNITFVTELPVYMLLIFLAIGILIWLGYNYLDWSNDIYRLTPDQIIDIEKKPLGREEKKTANLDDILSVEHERANLLGILLNFGTVTINVGQTKFLFYNVFNPDQVHQDIADYREALNRTRRLEEKKRERQRMVNWLLAYNKESDDIEETENEFKDNSFPGHNLS
jgi:uncharacterized membrane protein YdbT with pleckstrin-like domain